MEMSLGDREAYKAYKKYKRKYKELRAGSSREVNIPETISTVCPNNPITYSLMPNCDIDTCQQVKKMKTEIGGLMDKIQSHEQKLTKLISDIAKFKSISVIQQGLLELNEKN